jgi:hypothetical protein
MGLRCELCAEIRISAFESHWVDVGDGLARVCWRCSQGYNPWYRKPRPVPGSDLKWGPDGLDRKLMRRVGRHC